MRRGSTTLGKTESGGKAGKVCTDHTNSRCRSRCDACEEMASLLFFLPPLLPLRFASLRKRERTRCQGRVQRGGGDRVRNRKDNILSGWQGMMGWKECEWGGGRGARERVTGCANTYPSTLRRLLVVKRCAVAIGLLDDGRSCWGSWSCGGWGWDHLPPSERRRGHVWRYSAATPASDRRTTEGVAVQQGVLQRRQGVAAAAAADVAVAVALGGRGAEGGVARRLRRRRHRRLVVGEDLVAQRGPRRLRRLVGCAAAWRAGRRHGSALALGGAGCRTADQQRIEHVGLADVCRRRRHRRRSAVAVLDQALAPCKTAGGPHALTLLLLHHFAQQLGDVAERGGLVVLRSLRARACLHDTPVHLADLLAHQREASGVLAVASARPADNLLLRCGEDAVQLSRHSQRRRDAEAQLAELEGADVQPGVCQGGGREVRARRAEGAPRRLRPRADLLAQRHGLVRGRVQTQQHLQRHGMRCEPAAQVYAVTPVVAAVCVATRRALHGGPGTQESEVVAVVCHSRHRFLHNGERLRDDGKHHVEQQQPRDEEVRNEEHPRNSGALVVQPVPVLHRGLHKAAQQVRHGGGEVAKLRQRMPKEDAPAQGEGDEDNQEDDRHDEQMVGCTLHRL
eukprot:Rhum_TRINITY_DN15243_c0_g1::Rhum_TRINITY_DN15243_c0_g1_i4::g.145981::m.145981